jgi:diguanylate cyclase (GGDEF)-like protein
MKRRLIKRALAVGGGAAVAAAACATVAVGALDRAVADVPDPASVLLVTSLLVLVVASLATRLRFEEPSARARRVSRWLRSAPALLDLQLCWSLLAGTYAILALAGPIEPLLYPMLYGVVAFSVSFQTRTAAWATVLAAIALELAAWGRGPGGEAVAVEAGLHIGFLGAAATVHAVFLRGLVRRAHKRHDDRLRAEVQALREEARDYRLIASALGPDSRAGRGREEEERRLAESAVETLRASIYYTLGLVKRALDARTCALLWLDRDGETLKIKELVSDVDTVTERRVVPLSGALSAIARDRSMLALPAARASQLPYYEGEGLIGAFLGVPVMDGPHVRGILCADRARLFDEREAALLLGATEQVVRAVQSEQVFTAVERAKYEMERFCRASDMLCRALTLDQVMETAFDAAAQIIDVDVAAIALYERDQRRHRIHRVRIAPGGESVADADQLTGLEFRENAGLASMVVKNKHYLPATGALRDGATPIFTKRIRLRNVESLLVLPLLCADEAIGSFTLASRRPGIFGKDVREMLGIIANQVAVSLQNAKMYRKMETMATTDGLTGLTNHRAFQARLADLLGRAERHGHRAAILLVDVDHFKKVNDTYGHPVGDEVLRRVARVLAEAVRKIDIVARYGGEEFAVVLEATDGEGALRLAERIREDVAAQTFDCEQGGFHVTLSCGVACFPDDAKDRETLIERADHALYHAKETGRNRVVSYPQFVAARNARRAG